MTEAIVTFELIVPDSAADSITAAVEDSGGHVGPRSRPIVEDGQSAFEPLVGIVAVIAVTKLTTIFRSIWRELTNRGSYLIIDARGERPVLEVVREPERSTLVVLTEGGQVSIHRPGADEPSWKDLERILQAGLTKGSGT
jgi:hypothetical protein